MSIFGFEIVRTNRQPRPTHLPDGTPLTPARQLALMQAEHAADGIMSAIRWAKRLAWLLVLIVMYVSYDDQHNYLLEIKMRDSGAFLIPIAFDAATVLCVMVIGTNAMKTAAKVAALAVVIFPVAASAYINVQASPTSAVAIVYVLVVCLIPAMELIKALMGADFSSMMDTEQEFLDAAKQPNASRTGTARRSGKVSEAEREARKRAGYDRLSIGEKRAWTARYRRRMERKLPNSPTTAAKV